MIIGSGGTPTVAALCFVASALLVEAMTRRWFGKPEAVIALALFCSLKMCRIVEFYGLNESMHVFFCLLAVDAYMRRKWVMCGLFCGGMCAIDYVGILHSGVLCAGSMFYGDGKDGKDGKEKVKISFRTLRNPLGFIKNILKIPAFQLLASCVLVSAPWYIPNILSYGNPVHPYFNPATTLQHISDVSYAAQRMLYRIENESLMMLALPCIVLRKWRKNADIMIVLPVLVLIAEYLFLDTIHNRFLLPVTTVFIIPLATGVARLVRANTWDDGTRWFTGFVFAIYLFGVILPICPIQIPISRQAQIRALVEFYPMLPAIRLLEQEYPGAKLRIGSSMSGYRFYINNPMVDTALEADFVIDPFQILTREQYDKINASP